MAKNLVPIPEVDFERDGIIFDNLGLPVGFDEERLLVDTNGLRRIRNIAFLGPAIFMGVSGTKRENMFNVAGVDEKGVATMGLLRRQKKKELVEDVSVLGSNYRFLPPLRPVVTIKHNLAEQAERIDEQKGADRFFNAQNYAECLNSGLTDGLAKAAVLRQHLAIPPLMRASSIVVLGSAVFNDSLDILSNNPAGASSLAVSMALFGTLDVALIKSSKLKLKESDFSVAAGWDRRLLGSFVFTRILR